LIRSKIKGDENILKIRQIIIEYIMHIITNHEIVEIIVKIAFDLIIHYAFLHTF